MKRDEFTAADIPAKDDPLVIAMREGLQYHVGRTPSVVVRDGVAYVAGPSCVCVPGARGLAGCPAHHEWSPWVVDHESLPLVVDHVAAHVAGPSCMCRTRGSLYCPVHHEP